MFNLLIFIQIRRVGRHVLSWLGLPTPEKLDDWAFYRASLGFVGNWREAGCGVKKTASICGITQNPLGDSTKTGQRCTHLSFIFSWGLFCRLVLGPEEARSNFTPIGKTIKRVQALPRAFFWRLRCRPMSNGLCHLDLQQKYHKIIYFWNRDDTRKLWEWTSFMLLNMKCNYYWPHFSPKNTMVIFVFNKKWYKRPKKSFNYAGIGR